MTPEVRPAAIPETLRPGEPAEAAVVRLAQEKAQAVGIAMGAFDPRSAGGELGGVIVLGADTAVVLDGTILGKPRDAQDARQMLHSLSGREHTVLTGVAMLGLPGSRLETGCAATRVRFLPLDGAAIDRYVATGDPLDKAGAYGIQSATIPLVDAVDGSLTNVIGLPVELVTAMLARFGV